MEEGDPSGGQELLEEGAGSPSGAAVAGIHPWARAGIQAACILVVLGEGVQVETRLAVGQDLPSHLAAAWLPVAAPWVVVRDLVASGTDRKEVLPFEADDAESLPQTPVLDCSPAAGHTSARKG